MHGGGGGDTLTVNDSTGPVVLFGDTSANGERYSATPETPNGTAYAFINTGNDIIDASGAKGIVVIDGGAGTDELTAAEAQSAPISSPAARATTRYLVASSARTGSSATRPST